MEGTKTATRAQIKRCSDCSERKPVTEFRRRFSGSDIRHSQCRECANAEARRRRQERRDRKVHKYNQQVNNKLKGLAAMAAATGEMVNCFGGVDSFVSSWKAALDRAGDAGKHYLTVRALQTVFTLIEACNELRELQPQPFELSDQDLQRTMLESVERIVQQNPVLAVSAAHRLGWDVIPRESPEEEDLP